MELPSGTVVLIVLQVPSNSNRTQQSKPGICLHQIGGDC